MIMETNIERFEINGFSVGIDDKDDVIEGKENDYIKLCEELWNYLHDDFQDSGYAETDYMKLCAIWENAYIPQRLIDMDDLNNYCDDNGIGVKDFLEYKDDDFSIYDYYFIDGNTYRSGNYLSDFCVDFSYIARLIINCPIEFCRYDNDIEDDTLLDFIERFKECVKEKNYWCKE